jgi:hypothetical protein
MVNNQYFNERLRVSKKTSATLIIIVKCYGDNNLIMIVLSHL